MPEPLQRFWRVCLWGLTFRLCSIRSQLYDEDSLNIVNQASEEKPAGQWGQGKEGGQKEGTLINVHRAWEVGEVGSHWCGPAAALWRQCPQVIMRFLIRSESRAIYTTASVSHWVRAASGSCKFPDSSGFQCAQTKRSNRQANLQQRCTDAYLEPPSMDP